MKDGKRTVKIVIEEDGTHGGKGFQLYMEGDKERIGVIAQDDLSPAEFWGMALFRLCCNAVVQTGSAERVRRQDTRVPNAPGSDEIN